MITKIGEWTRILKQGYFLTVLQKKIKQKIR